jgi:hypothetical protein
LKLCRFHVTLSAARVSEQARKRIGLFILSQHLSFCITADYHLLLSLFFFLSFSHFFLMFEQQQQLLLVVVIVIIILIVIVSLYVRINKPNGLFLRLMVPMFFASRRFSPVSFADKEEEGDKKKEID